MLSKYYKKLRKIYVFSYLRDGRKECFSYLSKEKECYYYGNNPFFAIPLYEYFTYMRIGVNNKYA